MLRCQKKIQHRQRYFFMIAIQLSHKPFMESYMSFIIFIYAISKASRGACGFKSLFYLKVKNQMDSDFLCMYQPSIFSLRTFLKVSDTVFFLIWLKCLAVIFLLKTTYGFVQKPAISLLPIPFAFLGGLAPLISRTNQIYTSDNWCHIFGLRPYIS